MRALANRTPHELLLGADAHSDAQKAPGRGPRIGATHAYNDPHGQEVLHVYYHCTPRFLADHRTAPGWSSVAGVRALKGLQGLANQVSAWFVQRRFGESDQTVIN